MARPTPSSRGLKHDVPMVALLLRLIFALVLLTFITGQAQAQVCPAFYRFVDFGLIAPDGTIQRGGPTYRAEDFAGAEIIEPDQTRCLDIQDVAKDGRGNPIPIVSSVIYAPQATGIDLTSLRLRTVADIVQSTEEYAADHRARLADPRAVALRGEQFLCAHLADPNTLSCQFQSPVGDNLALVVYCNVTECRMPALAAKQHVVADATWRVSPNMQDDPKAYALEIADKIQRIHDFLKPLTS